MKKINKNAYRVTLARKSIMMSQEEMAEKLGICRQTAARLESGSETIKISTIKKVADLLGVEAMDLIGDFL